MKPRLNSLAWMSSLTSGGNLTPVPWQPPLISSGVFCISFKHELVQKDKDRVSPVTDTEMVEKRCTVLPILAMAVRWPGEISEGGAPRSNGTVICATLSTIQHGPMAVKRMGKTIDHVTPFIPIGRVNSARHAQFELLQELTLQASSVLPPLSNWSWRPTEVLQVASTILQKSDIHLVY
jgi:hypothetical protein